MHGSGKYATLSALLLISTLSGCTTTGSRQLVVAVQEYEARSREAVSALEEIERKVVEQPSEPEADTARSFANGMLHPRATVTAGYVQQQIRPFATAESRSPATLTALSELRCVQGRFSDALASTERAGIFGKRTIAKRAPLILDQLLTQQMYMAHLVQSDQWVQFLGRRNALVARIVKIRNDAERDDARKRDALLVARADWLVLEKEEGELRAEALSALLKAAATGVTLRKQVQAYGKWSLDDLSDSAKGLTAFITSISGRDLSSLSGKLDEIRGQILADPALAGAVDRHILAQLPSIAVESGGQTTALDGDRTSAVATLTPCLDRRNGTASSGDMPNGRQ